MSEQRKKRGDHPDGRLIKDIDAFHIYFANLAPRKSTTEVWLKESVDVTDLLQYIRNKNLNNPTYKTTVFHAMLTVIAKTVHHRPYLTALLEMASIIKETIFYYLLLLSKSLTMKHQKL